MHTPGLPLCTELCAARGVIRPTHAPGPSGCPRGACFLAQLSSTARVVLTFLSTVLRRTAPSLRTSTHSPWRPAPVSTTTCARSRGRTVPPPPSPSRTPTSRPSTAPATKRCLCHQCRGMTHAFTDVSSSRICSADVLMTAQGKLATGRGNGRFRGFGRNVDNFSLNRRRCASDKKFSRERGSCLADFLPLLTPVLPVLSSRFFFPLVSGRGTARSW